MNLTDLVQGSAGQQLIQDLSSQIGEKDQKVSSAISMALPFLLSQMNKNASSKQGADSLNKALNNHAGGTLDNIAGILNSTNMEDGLGILGHVFGNKQTQVAENIGKSTGLSSGNVMQILATLAPIVMSFLGKEKQQSNLDANGVTGLLGSLLGEMQQNNQSEMSMIERLLDQDGDGSITDDILDIGGKLLGGFFGKK